MAEAPKGATQGPAQQLYTRLESARRPYLDRARECAKLTIPSLLPPDGHSNHSKLYQPFQGSGARGVNNLSAKLLLALLPPNSPFFRLKIDPFTADKMAQEPDFKTKIETGLGKMERAVMDEVEGLADRVAIFELLKHLIALGNALFWAGEKSARVFRLDTYVVQRDPQGLVLHIVVKETVSPLSLDATLRQQIGAERDDTGEKNVEVFTHIYLKGEVYHQYQEVKGIRIPDTDATYPKDKTPWMPLRMIRVDGEDYGRSYVEEYFGDLKSLESLSRSIVEGSAAAAKVLFLVKPNGTTRQKTLAEAPNGAIREGNADDVSTLQMEKYSDFRVALETMNRIEERLAYAFLQNTAVQRQAERVTAEEVRYMAQELESTLGGIYSILSQEFQVPYVNRRMAVMQRAGRLPKLPKDTVKVAIVTGMEALGRGNDRTKLTIYIQTLSAALGPETVASILHPLDFAARLAASDGIDSKGLVKTQEEMAAEQQAQQQQQMMSMVTPEAMKAMGSMAVEGVKSKPKGPNG